MSKPSGWLAALWCAVFSIATIGAASATTMTSVLLQDENRNFFQDSDPLSSEQVIAPDFLARASADPLARLVRNEIRTPTTVPQAASASQAYANASIEAPWTCTVGCSSGPATGVSVNLSFHLTGAASPIDNYGEFTAIYEIQVNGATTAYFNLLYYQDDPLPTARAAFFGSSGDTVIPVTVTFDALTNAFDISASATVTTNLCPSGCGTFTDRMSLQSRLSSGSAGPAFIDASHTFSVDMTLLDPGLVFVSEDGRTLGAATTPPTQLSEPMPLIAFGAGLAWLRLLRRWRGIA